MNLRRYVLEGITLIIAAALCATVANAIASRERKLQLAGAYPNALRVPAASSPEETATPSLATPANAPSTLAVVPPAVTTAATATEPVASPSTTSPAKNPSTPKQAAATTTTAAAAVPAPQPSTAAAPAAPRVDVSKFQPHPEKAYTEIAFDDVAALHASGALTLDARRTSVYELGHIAGARPFSVWESDIDQKVNKLFEERGDPREQAKPIVIYCSGGECEDSHMLAQKLWGIQFNNIYIYRDGFPDWQKRGGAVHTGGMP